MIDIGAWDGFFSFEAERRGAARVLAVDSFCWSGAGWGKKAGFELAREALRSKVEDAEIEVLDLDPNRIGVFDVVLFLGVLYHMRHPLLALEKVAAVTKGLLVLEAKVDLLTVPAAGSSVLPCERTEWRPNQLVGTQSRGACRHVARGRIQPHRGRRSSAPVAREKGDWPSFVTEIKKAAKKNKRAAGLLAQLESSYKEKVGIGSMGYCRCKRLWGRRCRPLLR